MVVALNVALNSLLLLTTLWMTGLQHYGWLTLRTFLRSRTFCTISW